MYTENIVRVVPLFTMSLLYYSVTYATQVLKRVISAIHSERGSKREEGEPLVRFSYLFILP